MDKVFNSGFSIRRLRLRLFLVVFLTILPAFGIIVYDNFAQRQILQEEAKEDTQRLASFVSDDQKLLVENAKQLLVVLSRLPEVHSEKTGCNQLLANILKVNPQYTNLGVADIEGNIFCSAVPLKERVNIKDRLYFQNALEEKGFGIGEYQVGRITGKPAINFGYPVLDSSGKQIAVVYTALDLTWINKILESANLPENSTATVIDENGVVLARYPEKKDVTGKDFSELPFVGEVVNKKEGVYEGEGLDGISRIYGFTTLAEEGGGGVLYIAVGIPKEVLFRETNNVLKQGIFILMTVAIMAFVTAWFIGNSLVLDYVAFINRTKDEFVFIATHDLRTPVTAIDGFVKLIKMSKEKFSKETEDSFQAIVEASERLKQLVNDLLQVARSESGTIKVELAPVDIVSLIESLLREVTPMASDKKVTLKTALERDVKMVMADEAKLKEVMENLLSNAIKFNREGGSVEVTTKKDKDALSVSVSDTGYGIPKQEQAKVFQKFFRYRGEETKDVPGTGLGLFVIRMLVEKMGGKITFVSEEGKGTTFTFSLALENVGQKAVE